jgi:hypothetical protein
LELMSIKTVLLFVASLVVACMVLAGCGKARWKAVDAQSADATFTDAGITISLRFGFGADGLIATAFAEKRGRLVGDKTTQAPWQGRFSNYADKGGMLVPIQSEVAWVLPEGAKTYYRSQMTSVSYEFSAPPDRKPKS